MSNIAVFPSNRIPYSQLIGCALLVAGTTVGAGMLGMPLITSQAGFIPAVAITVIVWAVMLMTGLLLLEVCLQVPGSSNILSLAQHFFGKTGRTWVGALFAFLYYALLTAYFDAGTHLISSVFSCPFFISLMSFSLLFGVIVANGFHWINKVNTALTLAMVASYSLLLVWGGSSVDTVRLSHAQLSASFFATPVLFSAFGFHNIIPSLVGEVGKNKKLLRLSIVLGTMLALVIFLLWQWLIIGSIPQDVLQKTLAQGMPVTMALQAIVAKTGVFLTGQCFAFFALTTSLLGVSFSMLDFLSEALASYKIQLNRIALTVLTFSIPILCVLWDPTLFDKALGIAGGFGEAILNGFIPIVFFLLYKRRRVEEKLSAFQKITVAVLSLFCFFVVLVELYQLVF